MGLHALAAAFCCLLVAQRSVEALILGGSFAGSAAAFQAALGPLFATGGYLSAGLAAAQNGSVSLVQLNATGVRDAVASASVDLLWLDAFQFACADLQSQALFGQPLAPLATAASADGLEEVGGALVARAASAVASLAALNRTVVSGTFMDAGGGLAQLAQLAQHNQSWLTFAAVLFAPTAAQVLADVASGAADVGFVAAGVLEASRYAEGTFRVVAAREGATTLDGGSAYPYQLTTPLYPGRVLAALPHVPASQRRAVVDALFELDAASPAAAAAGLAGFNPPLPYGAVAAAVAAAGLVQPGGLCVPLLQPTDALVCPPASYRLLPDVFEESCTVARRACPPGDVCACDACAPAPLSRFQVSVAPADVPQNLSACVHMTICNVAPANTSFGFVSLTDTWFGDAAVSLGAPAVVNVSFEIHNYGVGYRYTSTEAEVFINVFYPSETDGSGKWTWLAPVSPIYGDYYLVTMVNGEILADEYILQIKPFTCLGFAELSHGVCSCPAAYTRVVSAAGEVTCLLPPLPSLLRELSKQATGGIAGGISAAALIAIYAIVVGMQRRSDHRWAIPREAIEFCEPPIVLGRGAYGLVLRASYRGTIVAVKRMRPLEAIGGRRTSGMESLAFLGSIVMRQRMSKTSTDSLRICGASVNNQGWMAEMARRRDFVREMRLLVHMRHPNVVAVLGAVMQSVPMMVIEHMDRGSLYDLMHNETLEMDIHIVLPILRDVAAGVEFLHSSRPPIIHKDLKSSNVLIDASFRAKISDFGLSGKVRKLGRVAVLGTPFYMAPELLRRETHNNARTDVYAFGVLMNEAAGRVDPYDGEEQSRVLSAVAALPLPDTPLTRPVVSADVPDAVRELIEGCWAEVPESRPTIGEVAQNLASIASALLLQPNEARPRSFFASAVEVFALRRAGAASEGAHALLERVFPPVVAAALAAGRKVEPQFFPVVTIFFSDIVGFTELASAWPALKVMQLLDRLYQVFDELAAEHGVFKVETIGGASPPLCALLPHSPPDSYMVCGGLVPGQDDDHTARVAAFALDAVAAARSVAADPDGPDPAHGIEIRAGFHVGPVVASVVGRSMPRYCLFGDSVNTASRMESSSEPGMVNLSDEAATLLRAQAPEAQLVSRGEVAVKGKGSMELWWLRQLPREAQSWRLGEAV